MDEAGYVLHNQQPQGMVVGEHNVVTSFLSGLASTVFGQTMVDCSPIKVLADHPVGQASELILGIIQIVTVVKQ